MHNHPHRYAMGTPDDADLQHERWQMAQEVEDWLEQEAALLAEAEAGL